MIRFAEKLAEDPTAPLSDTFMAQVTQAGLQGPIVAGELADRIEQLLDRHPQREAKRDAFLFVVQWLRRVR